MIEAGADVKAKDNNGNTALIYLFDREPKVDAPDIVQKLIDGGVDVNDYDLKNPLEYAHVCKLKKSEKILIKAGVITSYSIHYTKLYDPPSDKYVKRYWFW